MCRHADTPTCIPIRIYHHYVFDVARECADTLTRRHAYLLGYIIIMVFGLAADVQMRRHGDHHNYIILQLFYVRIHDESSKEVFNMRLQYESSVGALSILTYQY